MHTGKSAPAIKKKQAGRQQLSFSLSLQRSNERSRSPSPLIDWKRRVQILTRRRNNLKAFSLSRVCQRRRRRREKDTRGGNRTNAAWANDASAFNINRYIDDGSDDGRLHIDDEVRGRFSALCFNSLRM